MHYALPFELNEVRRRIAEGGEVELTLMGFPYVCTMPSPSSAVRIDGPKEFVIHSEGFALPLERSESCRKARKLN